jgi:hypothetical protein
MQPNSPAWLPKTKSGTQVELEVLRKREMRHIKVTIGELASDTVAASGAPQKANANRLGLSVRPLPPQQAKAIGVKFALIVAAIDPARHDACNQWIMKSLPDFLFLGVAVTPLAFVIAGNLAAAMLIFIVLLIAACLASAHSDACEAARATRGESKSMPEGETPHTRKQSHVRRSSRA